MTYVDTQLLIDGTWRDAADGRTRPVVNPATGSVIGAVAQAGPADLDAALDSAQRGFELWSDMTPAQRGAIMRQAATLLRDRVEEIARLMTQEQGKPVGEARAETLAAADITDWFADEGLRVYGRTVPSRTDNSVQQVVVKDPVGPVVAYAPWNFPINQVIRKLAAALAAGCSILIKGPNETPASPAALVRAFHDAGVPAGVIGIVYGDSQQISEHLIPSPIVQKVSFTGSTPVGKQLASLAGQHMKRVSMELGGHAPVIICADADVELAAEVLSRAKFRNAGQVCTSPTRFLVANEVKQQFATRFAEVAMSLRVGDGLDAGTEMGPLANERRLEAMTQLHDDAIARGAVVLTGGTRVGEVGNFWAPTVLVDVPTDSRIFNEEPFGPIAPIWGFDELDDAIVEANRLPYGLAGFAFTSSLRNADLIRRKVKVGMMWVNMAAAPSAELPFGGMKDSGYGTEGGPEALECYLNTRTVAIRHL